MPQSCDTQPDGFAVRSRLIQVTTRAGLVIFRIDSQLSTDAKAQGVASGLWRSFRVATDHRVVVDVEGGIESVHGGAGVMCTDYRLIRPATIFGRYIGGVLSAVLFGALLTLLLMRVSVPSVPALVVGQILLVAIRAWGAEREGTWELDLPLDAFSAMVGIAILRRWAERRWQKRHPTPKIAAGAAETKLDP